MRKVISIVFLSAFVICHVTAQDISFNKVLQTIAIGSCNRQEAPQTIWTHIRAQNPDLWIWLGDNIYGDTEDMGILKAKYDKQKSDAGYRELISTTPVIGIWDDHDFGVNDGGVEFAQKKPSRDLMFEFLDVPKSSPAWKREGGHQSYEFGMGDRKVKILLLDARYFRSKLERENRTYMKNWDGDILGEAQWQWLEKELTDSDAAVHILASGIQFIAEEHPFEKWANFPKERQRLLDLLVKTQPQNAFFLSGDRHISEIARINVPGYGMFYDFTSSGMTHSYESSTETNSHRIGKLITTKSFGLIQIDWSADKPKVTLEMRSNEGELLDKPLSIFDN